MSALWTHGFPSADLVSAAAALLTPLRKWDGSEGPRRRIVVGPGVVQIARHDPARAERTAERATRARSKTADLAAVEINLPELISEALDAEKAVWALVESGLIPKAEGFAAAQHTVQLEDWADQVDAREGKKRGKITAWSRKSRANMTRTLASVDYAPLFASGRPPAMLTITYPGCDAVAVSEDRAAGRRHVCDSRCPWTLVAADASAPKRHLDTLKKRFLRHYGTPLVGAWKREFQRRGAPHYHIHMTPPETLNGETFQAWFARTWVDIVDADGALSPEQRADFLAVQLGPRVVDYAEGMRASDPRRLAVYFSKHGSYSAKDYQNNAPELWQHSPGCLPELNDCQGCGKGVGRFWGLWGLEKGTRTVEVTDVEGLAAARTLRRLSRATRPIERVRVQNPETGVWSDVRRVRTDAPLVVPRDVWRTNTRTGAQHVRKARRRVHRMPGQSGFLCVNDGPALVSTLVRHLDQVRTAAQRSELAALGAPLWVLDAEH